MQERGRWFNAFRVSTLEINVVSELVGFLLYQVRFGGARQLEAC